MRHMAAVFTEDPDFLLFAEDSWLKKADDSEIDGWSEPFESFEKGSGSIIGIDLGQIEC